MERNPQIELAEKYVMETGVSVFLTGKAGTGKTTLLHHIVANCNKRHVVLAPTGVAAVNCSGVTIHSFFQLPFCPFLPDVKELVTEYQMPEQQRQLRKSKLDIIRTLELLIIDEISMVRADLLDAIDDSLRRFRRSSKPFGGVQLLLIGDVQQLAPVVTEDERPYMERVYPSPFFFHSKALQRTNLITIQLTKVYRQQDPTFVNLLNNIRDNHFDQATLDALNSRVIPANRQITKSANQLQDPILLTTHNHQADRVNQQRLAALDTTPFTLTADIEGNFPEGAFPTDYALTLKPGAQVMFVKNDSSGARNYFNGKLATVEGLETATDADGIQKQVIVVRDQDGQAINVGTEVWENIKYEIDPKSNEIKQVVDGTFTQYPLRTAWAVTIHKAQGLTFDQVQVDASAAFTYGQVYVALSRCRSLEGLTLLSPISQHNSFDSSDITHFNTTLNSQTEAEERLDSYRTQYYYSTIFELFDFSAVRHNIESLERLFQNNLRSTYPQQCSTLTLLATKDLANLTDVAERFQRQLMAISQQPDNQAILADRIAKATDYFFTQLNNITSRVNPILQVSVDNKEVAKRLKELSDNLQQAAGLKAKLLSFTHEKGFSIADYLKAKADFVLEKPQKAKATKIEDVYADSKNPKLVKRLTRWRASKAKELSLPAYTIISQKALLGIADALPTTGKSLLKVSGMGTTTVAKYGMEIVQMVEDYIAEVKQKATPAWQTAAQLCAEGLSIDDIAGRMLRAVSTVEGYLLTAVENGSLDPDLVMDFDEQEIIVKYMLDHPETKTLKEVFDHFNGEYSYLKLRIARFLTREL
ncbi:MAG: AAA family ATPase [Bacteroidales bacterium]|nr:AAA family ATPase [Bacteroidales bacterium]